MKTDCKMCEGSGIYYAPDGEDDFEAQYCMCREGRWAEMMGVGKVVGITV